MTQGDRSGTEPRFSRIREVVIPIGSLIATAAVVVQVRATLPAWFLIVAAGFYMLTFVTILWSLWPSVARAIANVKEEERRLAFVRANTPHLVRLVQRFEDNAQINRSDKLPFMLLDLNRRDEFASRLGPSRGDFHLLGRFLESFKTQLSQFRGAVSDFERL